MKQEMLIATVVVVLFLSWGYYFSLPSVMSGYSQTLDSGVVIEDTLVGDGMTAVSGQKISVHYIGTLPNGTKFYASRDHGDSPFTFTLGVGEVIKGWDEGLVGMRVGGKRKLTIPPLLAYGNEGSGVIPPGSTLIFDVELLKVQ
ncbi:MAG: FKBP-type peptidyl-prolyl cis-trans isomerase [Candidatus Parcubacteria bacterium]|nr:FKBP-type peptidyl-prolyl cis-trans isomerase [Candidatus Parcubacteria bacterium]